MKRNLTSEERKYALKGTKQRKEKINRMTEEIAYNEDLLAKQKYFMDFDDRWREQLRKQKEKKDQEIMKIMNMELDSELKALVEEEKQLKEGVEIKKVVGID